MVRGPAAVERHGAAGSQSFIERSLRATLGRAGAHCGNGQPAVRPARIAVGEVSVIAALGRRHDAVAASRARCGAAVKRGRIAVVAFLAGVKDAVVTEIVDLEHAATHRPGAEASGCQGVDRQRAHVRARETGAEPAPGTSGIRALEHAGTGRPGVECRWRRGNDGQRIDTWAGQAAVELPPGSASVRTRKQAPVATRLTGRLGSSVQGRRGHGVDHECPNAVRGEASAVPRLAAVGSLVHAARGPGVQRRRNLRIYGQCAEMCVRWKTGTGGLPVGAGIGALEDTSGPNSGVEGGRRLRINRRRADVPAFRPMAGPNVEPGLHGLRAGDQPQCAQEGGGHCGAVRIRRRRS